MKASSPLSSPDLDEIKASRSADWDESKHPRDRDGKWTSGGGSVLSSKPMQSGDEVVDLHREHGVSVHRPWVGTEAPNRNSGKRRGTKIDAEDYSKIGRLEVENIMNLLTVAKSRGHSVDKARELLVAFHDDAVFQRKRKSIDRLQENVVKFGNELTDTQFTTLTPQREAYLKKRIADSEAKIEAKIDDLEMLHDQRYREMWSILFANDSPHFDEDDFDIGPHFTSAEREQIRKGIEFISRMADFDKLGLPNTKDLKFVKVAMPRSGYLDRDAGPFKANSILLGQDRCTYAVVHEMGHWLEQHHPEMRELLKQHYDARTKGENARFLAEVGQGFRPDEKYKEDRFLSEYMGKICTDEHGNPSGKTEILTVGLETFFLAPDFLAKKDPDTFNFIYQLLRGETPDVDPKSKH